MSQDLFALWEEVERGLRQLVADVRDRLDLEALREIEGYLDHNELGLAAEGLAYSLAQIDPPLSSQERERLHAIGARMDLDLSESEELGRKDVGRAS